jgi:hypothetical protein
MTGTPSRTATAFDGGLPRHSAGRDTKLALPAPRGFVERKLQAKLRSEEYEAHMRHVYGGRDCLVNQSPMSSGPTGVYAADMWSEGHAPYPGNPVCLLGRRQR